MSCSSEHTAALCKHRRKRVGICEDRELQAAMGHPFQLLNNEPTGFSHWEVGMNAPARFSYSTNYPVGSASISGSKPAREPVRSTWRQRDCLPVNRREFRRSLIVKACPLFPRLAPLSHAQRGFSTLLCGGHPRSAQTCRANSLAV